MGDSNSSTPQIRTTRCRTPDQWINLEYHYDDFERNPVANMPFEVVCKRDPSISVRGTTGADGKAHVTGLIPGPVDIRFQPDSDAEARQQARQLRKDLQQSLDAIITGIEQSSRFQQELLQGMNLAEKGLVYTGAFMHGVWEGATEFADFMVQAAPLLKKMGLEYLDIWTCIVTGDIDALERKLRAAQSGAHQIADSTQENLETLFLLLSDPDVRSMLYAFPERYWDAHSSVDKTHMAGSMGSDLIVALVIGALTGGAGTAATVGKIAAKGGALAQKAMSQLADLAKAMKKIKPKLQFHGSTQSTRKMTVPKTRPNNPASARHASDSNKPATNANGDLCSPLSKTCTSGEPVSMITGEELLEQTDFTVPGLIPLAWKRLYRTSNARHRGLGHGWTYPACETLQVGNDAIIYEDAEGRRIEFPVPDVGQFSTNSAEGLLLHREWHSLFYLKQPGQPDKLFSGRHTLRLTALIDSVGNRWDCFYDDATQLIARMEASWGPRLHFALNPAGQIDAIQQHLPGEENPRTLARYHYSPQRDLIAVADAGGDAEHFQYHQHIIVRRTLRTGFSFYFEWDQYSPRAKCLRQYGDDLGDGPVYDYRFEWDPQNRINRSTDSNGNQLQVHYNERGLVEQETDPLGNITRFQYDEAGRLILKTDPQGGQWQYHYDEIGNLTAQLDPAGGGFTLLYDDDFRLTEYSDAQGHTWTREYNEQGLPAKTTDAEGNETRYYYNPQGQPEIIVDPHGQKRLLAWAPNGTLLTQVHASGEPVHYRYDNAGQVRAVEQAGHTTRYDYNAKGDIVAIHHPDGGSAHLQWNANRQLIAHTDTLGRTTRFEYDGLAQIRRRIDPAGRTLDYQYDRERNLTGLINEKGEHYQLKYDACERLIEEVGFDGRVQQYEYNPLGHLIAHIEGRYIESGHVEGHYDLETARSEDERTQRLQQQQNNTTRFQRDPLGRLLQKHSPDGDHSLYTYSRNGRLASAVNRARTLAFEYTPNGLLQAEIQDLQRIEHTYDPTGNRIATTLPGGQQLQYEYNHQGLFTALDFNGQRITQLERNPLGQETFRSQGNLCSGFDYDPSGRLTRHWVQHHNGQHAIIDRQYQYDPAGRLHGIDDLRKGATRYVYDQLDRLKAVEGYASEQFEFDPAGNILGGSAMGGAAGNVSGSASGNRLPFHGDRHFSYDARGNLTEERRGTGGKLVTHYTYNSQNQLIKVEKGGQVFEYAYDALGRRIRKKDAFGETEFLWNGDVLLSEQRNHAQKLYLYEPGSFKPLAFIENNQCYFYHNDHLGTPQELTDWEGRIVWSARYKVYGNVAKQEVEAVENNLRFQGQYFDAETGLHYNRFRYYDPGTGQFVQQDPIGLLGGINNYQYAPNATGWVDPLGLVCKELTSWNQFQQDTKGHFVNSSEAAKSYNRMKEVQAMDKGARPDPSTYLPQSYIDAHLQKFDTGAAYLVPENVLNRFGRDVLGCPDNSQFVMTKTEMDDLLKRANGDVSYIEKELGIPAGSWSGQTLKRIDIPDTSKLNLRFPSGNEWGANSEWLAGGKLPTDYSEAIIDKIPKGAYTESGI